MSFTEKSKSRRHSRPASVIRKDSFFKQCEFVHLRLGHETLVYSHMLD